MSEPFPITIYHNPQCGTSRNVLAMIRAAGQEPRIVPYLETGWDPATLARLVAASGGSVRALLREKGTPAAALGLLDAAVPDEAVFAAMLAHPVLVNRPIVETPKGVRLCRPSEQVFALLETPPAQFTKEDGEIVRR
jgi:arsenate reductase